MKRVLILGGGFGGIYAALEFEKRQDPDFEVTLISQDNFFLFTPMLHEVAASDCAHARLKVGGIKPIGRAFVQQVRRGIANIPK